MVLEPLRAVLSRRRSSLASGELAERDVILEGDP